MLEELRTHLLETTTLLKNQGLKIATAESCTGGGLMYWLTSMPGSSAWVDRGFVTYSNLAKIQMLAVPEQTLHTDGAVSEATAIAMAVGAITHSDAHIAISITGIAGPDGGSVEKPVGTVWIGWAGHKIGAGAQLFTFSGDRDAIRLATIIAALKKVQEVVE